MLDDFLPIKIRLDEKDYRGGATIVPLGDVHYGSREFNSVRWHEAVKRIQDDPKCFAVLVGDMIDNGVKSSVSNVYEQTCSPREQKAWLTEELKPIKDKILAAVGGNHERRSAKEVDDDPLYDVMVRLGLEDRYRPNIAFLSVAFSHEVVRKTQGGKREAEGRCVYVFAITHGAGGGMYATSVGGRLTNFSLSLSGVDCLIVGHTHKPLTFPVSRLIYDHHAPTVRQDKFTVVVAPSFLDYGGYPVQKLLTPAASGLTEIFIKNDLNHKRDLRVLQ